MAKTLVDTSTFEIAELQDGDQRLIAEPPLSFLVAYDQESSCYFLKSDIETCQYEYSREDLKTVLIEHLQLLWIDFEL